MLGRQFTSQSFNLNDELWGEKSGDDPGEHALPTLQGDPQRSACATLKQLHGECPSRWRSPRWASLRQRRGSFWLVAPENTATYILLPACATRLPQTIRERAKGTPREVEQATAERH